MTSKDSVARKLQELIDSQSNFQLGQLTSSASTGGTVTAKLPNGRTVTAKAGNDCSGGQCSLFRLEDGTYIAMSGNASSLISQQTTTFRQSRTTSPTESGRYLKVLFSKVEDSKRIFYIGGDRSLPEKVHETSESDVVRAAYISATGEGKDKWVVALALQAGTAVTIWHITATESEKKSWTDTNNEIFPLLTYNGFGMWSAGTFIAPTMQSSRTTATAGDAETITTTYTVDRPSFVTGTGQVYDVTIDKKKTIKKAEKCYEAVMRPGACVSAPETITGNTFDSTYVSIYSYMSADSVRNSLRALGFADGDQVMTLPVIQTTSSLSAWEAGLLGLMASVGSFQEALYYFYPTFSVRRPGALIKVSDIAKPYSFQRMGTICAPPYPAQEQIACPGTGYGPDTAIPGSRVKTISGGYRLSTKSFLINNGEYSDREGTVGMTVAGTGVAAGSFSLQVEITTTYFYLGASWIDRDNLANCQGNDRTLAVDIEPGQSTTTETREVCLAVGKDADDRMTYSYTQQNNDRQEKLFLNSNEVSVPLGFLLYPSPLAEDSNGLSFSSTDQLPTKSEYKESLRTYTSNPEYNLDFSSLRGSRITRSYSEEIKATLVGSEAIDSTKRIETGYYNLSGLEASPVNSSVQGNITSSVSMARISVEPVTVQTSESVLFKRGNSVSSLLSDGFTGLLAEPEGGFVDLANPYLRAMSVNPLQSDTASPYQNILMNVVRPLGNPTHVFYDSGRIMVSVAPDKTFSYASKDVEVIVLPGAFNGGSFSWGVMEKRRCHSLVLKPEDNTSIVHSTTAWF